MRIELEFTKEELEALDDYSFRKMCRLEDSDLTDALCYKMFSKIHQTIIKELSKNKCTNK